MDAGSDFALPDQCEEQNFSAAAINIGVKPGPFCEVPFLFQNIGETSGMEIFYRKKGKMVYNELKISEDKYDIRRVVPG